MASSEFSGKTDEMLRGNLAMDWHPIQEGVVILLGNRDKHRGLGGPIGSRMDLSFPCSICKLN